MAGSCCIGAALADVTVASWNVAGGQLSPYQLSQRVVPMVDRYGSLDILVLQEVVSEAQVVEVAHQAGFKHWAMSDFAPPISVTGKWYKSLEVAILSRFPIQSVTEWDTTGRLSSGDGYAPLVSLSNTPAYELDLGAISGAHASRGFLRVDLDNGLSIFAVHWKSSLGQICNDKDTRNAAKREFQAQGTRLGVDMAMSAGRRAIVAGDFNIQAFGYGPRSGLVVSDDCQPVDQTSCDLVCGEYGADGYDDSLAILLNLPDAEILSPTSVPTYLGGDFGPGAIDHIIGFGFTGVSIKQLPAPDATSESSYLGSDHLPVAVQISD